MFKPDTRTVGQFSVTNPVAGSSQMSPSRSNMPLFLPVQSIFIFDILQQDLLDITGRSVGQTWRLLFRSTQYPCPGHVCPRSRSSLCALPYQSLQSFFFSIRSFEDLPPSHVSSVQFSSCAMSLHICAQRLRPKNILNEVQEFLLVI